MTTTIWTDGSTRPTNPGPGGCAWLIRRAGKTVTGSAGYYLTTNNRMELQAAIEALCLIQRGSTVTVFSDSAYVVYALNKGWLRKWLRSDFKRPDGSSIKNIDLWRKLFNVSGGLDITWEHIHGHAGFPDNERVDELAGEAAEHPTRTDIAYERSRK